MSWVGITIHHSLCDTVRANGYDFYVTREGMIVPSAEAADTTRIHICVEGDFSRQEEREAGIRESQFYVVRRLVGQLCETFGLEPADVLAHAEHCPGDAFPWAELVIYPKDGYH